MEFSHCRRSHRQNRQKNECQRLLEKLKREQAIAAATHQYPAASCPVCLEDFDGSSERRGEAATAAPSAPPFSSMRVHISLTVVVTLPREKNCVLSVHACFLFLN